MSEELCSAPARGWDAYLEALEVALAGLQEGLSVEVPAHGDLGPLPAEARERASALLVELRSTAAALRSQRQELGSRLEVFSRLLAKRGGLVA